MTQKPDETVLTLWYMPNGEHAATFPEVRTREAGLKAAKTYMEYANQFGPVCYLDDLTKE